MIRYVVAGLLSMASLVPLTASAQSYPSCRTYCTYGQCGPCSMSTWDTDCYIYNGCGGKYPIPVAPEMEAPQASTGSTSAPEEVLVCAPREQDEASASVQG